VPKWNIDLAEKISDIGVDMLISTHRKSQHRQNATLLCNEVCIAGEAFLQWQSETRYA
jgi:hypothetical protein